MAARAVAAMIMMVYSVFHVAGNQDKSALFLLLLDSSKSK